MHPVERIKQLIDPARLAVAGALAIEPATSEALTGRTGLDRRKVLDSLGALSMAGLVAAEDGVFRLDVDAMRATARELATVELPMDPAIGYGMTDEERVVLSRFFHGRTLHELPGNRAKRLVVLHRLALEFDVGRKYHEFEVNEILGAFNPDWSTLRRHLVDEGFMDRDQNEYWRCGGRVESR